MKFTGQKRSGQVKALLLAGTALTLAGVGFEQARAEVSEVIVTARKRAENVQNIPVSVTVVSEKQLNNNNLTSIERLAAQTPELQVVRGASGSGAQMSVRGIGNTSTSAGIEQSVAVNIDGVYYGHGRILNEGMFDMRQVEVLKGPQALFFGKNATAGVISFTTNEPTQDYEASARLGYEFRGANRYGEAIVSGPITESLSARFGVRASSMEKGYIKNGAGAGTSQWLDIATGALNVYQLPKPKKWYPAGEDLVARITLKWKPTDNFDMVLRGSVSKALIDNGALNAMLYKCPINNHPQGDPTSPVPCNRDWIGQNNDAAAESSAVNPYFGGRYAGRTYNKYNSSGVTLTTNYELPILSINNVTNYYEFTNVLFGDADVSAQHQNLAAVENLKRAFSNELRFTSHFKGPVNVMAGIYYQKQHDGFWNTSAAGLPGALFGLPRFVNTQNSALRGTSRAYLEYTGWEVRSITDGKTWSPFAQVIWDITPTLTLTGGARYTEETKKSYYRMPYVHPIWQSFVVEYNPANPATQILADQKFTNTSPEATLTWRPNGDLTLYGAYKEGFKSGGFSNSSLFRLTTVPKDLAFDPETVKGWEGGFKSYLLDRTVRFDVTFYTFDYTNMQIDFLDLANVRYITYNAGSSKTRGMEAQLDWSPAQVPELNMGFRLNYNDAYYKDFRFAACYLGQTPAQGCANGPVPTGGSRPNQDLSGHHTAVSPKWTGAVMADYERPLGNGLKFGISGNARYSSSYNTIAFGNEANATQKSYVNIDGALRIGSEDELWQVSLIGKNLTNKFVVLAGTEVGGANTGLPNGVPGDQAGYPNLPRTVELQVAFKF